MAARLSARAISDVEHGVLARDLLADHPESAPHERAVRIQRVVEIEDDAAWLRQRVLLAPAARECGAPRARRRGHRPGLSLVAAIADRS